MTTEELAEAKAIAKRNIEKAVRDELEAYTEATHGYITDVSLYIATYEHRDVFARGAGAAVEKTYISRLDSVTLTTTFSHNDKI